jgi:hypothetical protein
METTLDIFNDVNHLNIEMCFERFPYGKFSIIFSHFPSSFESDVTKICSARICLKIYYQRYGELHFGKT